MLVDPTFKPFSEDHQAGYRQMAEEHNAKYPPDDQLPLELSHPPRLGLGVYQASNLSERHIIEKVCEDVPAHRDHRRPRTQPYSYESYEASERAWRRPLNRLYTQKYQRNFRPLKSMGAYGICDTPTQLLEYFPHIQDDDVPRFITVSPMWRKHQHPQGGFRYHKSGQYIGKQKPKHEYLYDDTHIDLVCVFHIWRIEDIISG